MRRRTLFLAVAVASQVGVGAWLVATGLGREVGSNGEKKAASPVEGTWGFKPRPVPGLRPTVVLTVSDPRTDRPVDRYRAELLAPDDAVRADEEYTSSSRTQTFTGRAFAPGTWRVRVRAAGFLPWTSAPVAFRAMDDRVELSADLVVDPDSGTVVFVPIPDAGAEVTRVFLLLRRSEAPESAWDAQNLAAWDAVAREIVLRSCPSGRWDAVLWEFAGTHARVGAVGRLDVTGSARTRLNLPMAEGVRISPDLLKGWGETRVTLSLPTVGRLPLVAFRGARGKATVSRSGGPPPEGALGPYPSESLTLTVEDGHGRRDVPVPAK